MFVATLQWCGVRGSQYHPIGGKVNQVSIFGGRGYHVSSDFGAGLEMKNDNKEAGRLYAELLSLADDICHPHVIHTS